MTVTVTSTRKAALANVVLLLAVDRWESLRLKPPRGSDGSAATVVKVLRREADAAVAAMRAAVALRPSLVVPPAAFDGRDTTVRGMRLASTAGALADCFSRGSPALREACRLCLAESRVAAAEYSRAGPLPTNADAVTEARLRHLLRDAVVAAPRR
jgi:hypothetical protein